MLCNAWLAKQIYRKINHEAELEYKGVAKGGLGGRASNPMLLRTAKN